nr:unnamed protein product [Spirometra erinaceieuropaei]
MHSHTDKLSPREFLHLDYISQLTSDIRHIGGSRDEMTDALSRPSIAHLQLSRGIDLTEMAAEQRRVGSPCNEDVFGLQLQELPLTTGNGVILCYVSTHSHRPFVPPSLCRIFFLLPAQSLSPLESSNRQAGFRPLHLAWDAPRPQGMYRGLYRLSTETEFFFHLLVDGLSKLPNSVVLAENAGTFKRTLDKFMLEVARESREFLTTNTHRGLFQYTRLSFGVKTTPALFQQTMNAMLSGIPGTAGYLDDIIIVGRSPAEPQYSNSCRNMAFAYGPTSANSSSTPSNPENIRATQRMPAPKNVSQLHAFLGLISCCSALLPSLHDVRTPLNRLFLKDAPWCWSPDCEKAFAQLKSILSSDLLLTHYDHTLLIVVVADASNHGDLTRLFQHLRSIEGLVGTGPSTHRDAALREICRIARLLRAKGDTMLYRKGDPTDCWYILLTGSVLIESSMFLPRNCFGTRLNASLYRQHDCFVLEESDLIVIDYIDREATIATQDARKTSASLANNGISENVHLPVVITSSIADQRTGPPMETASQQPPVIAPSQLTPTSPNPPRRKSSCSLDASGATAPLISPRFPRKNLSAGNSFLSTSNSPQQGVSSPASNSLGDSDDDFDASSHESLRDAFWEALLKEPPDRTVEDIETLVENVQKLPAFSNLSSATRYALCSIMLVAVVREAGQVVLSDGEVLDAWSVILNGTVEPILLVCQPRGLVGLGAVADAAA